MEGPPEKLEADFNRDTLSPRQLRAVYDYWLEARGKEEIPPVVAIDPTRLPVAALPYLSLLEVEPSPLRFRCRLTGTCIVDALGVDHTGRYIDDIAGMTMQLRRMAWCVRHRRPYLVSDQITFAPRNYKSYRCLGLPFGDAEHGVQRLLFVFAFADGESAPTPRR